MNTRNWKNPLLYILAGLIIGAGLGILLLFGFGDAGNLLGFINSHIINPAPSGPVIGSPAPDFSLMDIKGETVHLSSLRGKPVLINFWATWCVPCAEEMPMIESMYEKERSQIEVLAVNADESNQKVQVYISNMGLTFLVLLDPGGNVQSLYRLRGYPTSFFIDRDGVVRAEHIGSMDPNQLNKYLLQVGVGE
jgi:cytochrome c biogenesis protein CcmG/thiol:disulfide interchange protein DsbE